VVRGDLAPGLQIAQACHAATTFMIEHPESAKHWLTTSNYIVVLRTESEFDLQELARQAREQNIERTLFREPDLEYELTAIALAPGEKSKKLCQHLKLALKGK
jgi:peptidyl-tRNA hydrolase